ncbi:AbrB/MazE/SpoVT family DNA-binding domain-containing protein [Geoglobus acetivorans]|uniref:AbrB/MazE/SpoVT family DNA-binding domain-containing protein n=1 Tax=Geoglobus acetivorans TaxID=565033 RepID=A0ABZ3H4Y0_GEOAI|nr:AbrB/MazE/SpoVT family DNA-binding domain-containing protein [Geoglobus acetivorans]
MLTSKLSKKGQVVIPKEIREKLRIKPGDVVVFREEGGRVYIETVGEKLTEILKAGKPVGESSVEFQRRLRDEWE